MPKNIALTISDSLSDEKARIPTFGSHSALYIPNRDVAVKTGTTNNNKDAWTIGYTPSIVVGVWAGNNDNIPMKKGGVSVAGPIWNKFINEALKALPDENFEKPDLELDPQKVKPILRGFWQGNENFFIDKISKKLASANTPKETLEEKVLTNVHSILYWVNRDDVTGAPPLNPSSNPQFDHFEIPIQNWWMQNKEKYSITTLADKPNLIDDVHTELTKPKISILEPNEKINYSINQKINLKISNTSIYPLLKLDIFINESYLGTYPPYSNISFTPEELENIQMENEIKVIAYDAVYNRSETALKFKVVK